MKTYILHLEINSEIYKDQNQHLSTIFLSFTVNVYSQLRGKGLVELTPKIGYDGSYLKELPKLQRHDVLILDDFGLQALDDQNRFRSCLKLT